MIKHTPKTLSTKLNLPNKYNYVLIKTPNGVITLCRSTYLPQDALNKLSSNNDNINIQDKKTEDNKNLTCINVDVDYTQYLLENKDKKKNNKNTKQKSARASGLNQKFLF